jgi:hypothetical protein
MALRAAACKLPVLRVRGYGCSMTAHRIMLCSNEMVNVHRWFEWSMYTHQSPPARSKWCSHTPSFSDADLVAKELSKRSCSPVCGENNGKFMLSTVESAIIATSELLFTCLPDWESSVGKPT